MNNNSKLLIAAAVVIIVSILISFISNTDSNTENEKEKENHWREVVELPLDVDYCAFGPESFAFDALGDGPYTGISDGRIIKFQQIKNRYYWTDFAITVPNRYALLFHSFILP